MADPRLFMLKHGVTYRSAMRLDAMGVEAKFVCELGARVAIGQAMVSIGRDGKLFEPVGPDACALLALFDEGGICDVLAFRSDRPEICARLVGQGAFLGFENLERAEAASLADRHVRLRVFADPLEWLRARGEGICVIDWGLAIGRLRQLGERITIETSPDLAVQMRAKLSYGGLPLVASHAPDGAAMRDIARRFGEERRAA